ncbi:ATP-dependent DNA helicase PIF1-like protein, partial [Tanacetum coccineum]
MDGYNRLIYDETSYQKDKLREKHVRLYGSLTSKQKGIYYTVLDAVDKNKGGMFSMYGNGALLFEGGRTAHSRFAIPINIVEDLMCHITADSDLADLIRKAKLIIWDEAPMKNRPCEIFAGDEKLYESSYSVGLADEDSNFDDSV